jgi:putative ABC transport system permease protein
MVGSLRSTVTAKAGVFVGSDVQARIDYGNVVPGTFPFPMTRVVRFPSAGTFSTGEAFDLLAVDPATLAAAAYWNDAFASAPLGEIARRLEPSSGGPLPVLVAGGAGVGIASIEVDRRVMPVRVVATASAFPGMVSLRPLVVVAEQPFLGAFGGGFNPLDVAQANTELWVEGDGSAIRRAIAGLDFPVDLVVTASEVEDIPYITAVVDTFVVLNVLGLAAALLVIVGMLMYLQARERSQVVSYGLSLRMGMTHGAHRRALVSELASMLASSYLLGALLAMAVAVLIVPLLDPLPVIPPGPLFVSPVLVMLAAGAGVVLAAWLGGWITNAWARRVDLGEVMRLAE